MGEKGKERMGFNKGYPKAHESRLRGKEGKRVDEMVDKPKVVTVLGWGFKVLCVPFQRRNEKTYYLACTDYKLPAKKAIERYRKGVQIGVLICILSKRWG